MGMIPNCPTRALCRRNGAPTALTAPTVIPYRLSMDNELSALEAKVAQAAAHIRQLREEGRELRQQVAARADENARLAEKLAAAKARIEALLKQIPETEA